MQALTPQLTRHNHDGVAVVCFAAQRGVLPLSDLTQMLRVLAGAANLRAVMLRGAGSDTCADVALTSDDDALDQLCSVIETFPVPVIACLHGRVDGAGLALALAAHYRWADTRTMVRSGDVRLGRVAGGGVTQRLPRVIGVDAALAILLNRQVLRADATPKNAEPGPFFDGIVDDLRLMDDPALVALLTPGLPTRPTASVDEGLRDPAANMAALQAARAAAYVPEQQDAACAVLDCVEAALLLPFDAGLERAAVLGTEVARGPVAAALLHLRRAEHRTLRIPELRRADALSDTDLAARPPSEHLPEEMVVAGADAPLVVRLLRSGFGVALWAPDGAQLQTQVEAVATLHEARLRANHLTAAALDSDWNRLTGHVDIARLPRTALILATPELADRAAAHLPPDGHLIQILHPDNMAHPIAPRQVGLAVTGQIAELIIGEAAPAVAVILAFHLAARLQMQPVRMNHAAAMPVLRGTIADCVAALRGLGLSDADIATDFTRAGLPTGFAGLPKPATDPLTAPAHPAQPFARLQAALLNAAASILQDGTAQRPSDIDLCLIRGLGWPRWRGGPCFEADQRGLLILRAQMERFSPDNPTLWAPQPLLLELIRNTWAFADLDES